MDIEPRSFRLPARLNVEAVLHLAAWAWLRLGRMLEDAREREHPPSVYDLLAREDEAADDGDDGEPFR